MTAIYFNGDILHRERSTSISISRDLINLSKCPDKFNVCYSFIVIVWWILWEKSGSEWNILRLILLSWLPKDLKAALAAWKNSQEFWGRECQKQQSLFEGGKYLTVTHALLLPAQTKTLPYKILFSFLSFFKAVPYLKPILIDLIQNKIK